ncbi:MAG: hypothetical protein ACMUHX_02170, partial [bacterium]
MKWVSVTVTVFLLSSLLIIGCGGGGSSFNVPKEDSGVENGTVEVHSIAFISATPQTIALKDTGGLESSVVVFKVVDVNNNPVSNRTINFELSTEAGGLSLSHQNDLSDYAGLVQVTVNAGNVSTSVRVTATLDSDPSITVDSDALFVAELFAGEPASIAFISTTLQNMALKGTGGNETSIIVFKVVDGYGDPVADQTVNFELSTNAGGLYLSNESAESDPNGHVRVTVNAGIVSTPVSVTAILDSDPSIKVVSVELFVGEAMSIDFISASPQTIALKDTGGPPRSETSVLYFKVIDVYGNPVPNQIVNFELSKQVGGLFLSNESAESNPDGLVRVTVNAGNMPTHIRVTAILKSNPSIRVASDELVVSTGLPDQDSINLKIVDIVDNKWTFDNLYAIEFHAADHFNNFVPDGTIVYFTTEGGSIDAFAPTIKGSSTVSWISGNPVPDDDTITILAFCIGEESFKDLNSNGLYDANEPLVKDLAEPFLDANENGVYDYGEWYWDSNNNGIFDGESNGIYNGTLCSDDAEAQGLCSKELVYVYKSLSLMKAEVLKDWEEGNASSIDFISASPQTIALKGTGGPPRKETSVLIFKVVDEYDTPVSNQTVNFDLSTEIGGLSLSSTSAVSNALGTVQVTVNAGNMPTHVRVHAFLAKDPSIRTVSDLLVVSTGLPDADSISISAETYNSESWGYDNVEVPILFLAADIFNNFVPDGTVVYFTTEGGAIIDSSPVKDGVCEVKWHSANPRPPDGLSQVLAFCIGEESFKDLNSNGLYDANEPLTNDLAEPFRDDNQNGIHDEGEWYWDYNTNGEFDGEPNGIYNGTLCSDAAEAAGACTKELVYVHASITLLMSGSFATINFYPDPVDLTGEEAQTVLITIADINNNPMPYKTKVELILTNGKFVDDSKSMEFNIGNTNLPGPTLYTATILPTKDAVTSGKLVVKVTTPFENLSMD